MSVRPVLTLGVHPTSRGFGWAAYEGPFSPYDWGVVEVRRDKNAVCLRKLGKLLERLRPATLVLEVYERSVSDRKTRIMHLCRALTALGVELGIEVAVLERAQVQACFAHVGAKTRHEIAEAVARHTPAFRDRLPAKRRAWDGEDPRMALFAAAALVVASYALDADLLLTALRETR